MNLFVFNQDTKRIVIAKDFWIYIATWLPLTLLTFVGYQLVVNLHKPRAEGGWYWQRTKSLKLQGP